jgi:ribosomal-protein-alanine N-acetyltransferase
MSYVLRRAVAADMAEIMRLERAGFAAAIQETEQTFAGRLSAAPEGCWVLAAEAGRLVGYLCAEFWPLEPAFNADRFARNHAAKASHILDGEELYVSSWWSTPRRAVRVGGAACSAMPRQQCSPAIRACAAPS